MLTSLCQSLSETGNPHCQVASKSLKTFSSPNMPAVTRTPEAEALDLVMVGSFNPAIFHPEWFLRQGLIVEAEAQQAQVAEVSAEVTFLQLCGFQIQCVSDRFSIGTSNISVAERMQDLVLGIFAKLPHTPITACGINHGVHYLVGDAAYWHRIGHTLAPKDLVWNGLLENPGMQLITIRGERGGPFPGEINVTVAPSVQYPPGIFVKSNYHYGIAPDKVHAGAAEQALKFMRSEWSLANAMARKAAEQIFTKIPAPHE